MLKRKYLLLLICISLFYKNQARMNLYVNSIPKCGTHLLTKCLSYLTCKVARGYSTESVLSNWPVIGDNEFLHCHIPYSIEIENKLINENYKVFFIYRDPRDQIISNSFWILEKPERYLTNPKPAAIYSSDINQIIDFFINEIDEVYARYSPWLTSKITCSVKFEDLIGDQGNGDIKKQKKAIKQICSHIKINNIKLDQTIDNCIKNLFGGTGTFRKGQIGSWKKYFSVEQKERFKKIGGQLLIDLGYEKDFNW